MSRVFPGDRFKILRSRLPSKLLVFDGQCLLSQARVTQILERNYFLNDHDTEANKILFTSTRVPEGREVLKAFPSICANTDSVVYVEKIPSSSGRLQRLNRLRSIGSMPLDKAAEESDDIRVSVKSKACLRVMMRLDRIWVRVLGRLGFYLLPRWFGDRIYDAVADRRRLWGTSEQDAVLFPKPIEGLKERTWRGYTPARATVNAAKAAKEAAALVAGAAKPKISLAPRLK
jgi:predicted DCC family thiol-disulfide oxidoreductase YuxK